MSFTVHKIGVIGLGYVGMPLAIEFSKYYKVLGYDISVSRVNELNQGIDRTQEIEEKELEKALKNNLQVSCNEKDLKDCNIYIVTVPTPIDKFKKPDLQPLIKASELIGKYLSAGDIVIYESTTYPGCTEEDCVPVLEKISGLKYNNDFYVGYSPERINPGDKINTLTKIKKVTSGSTVEIAKIVDDLYKTIIEAGTFSASNIKVAEASKAIENAQRDLNISFVNELAIIFEKLNIDTNEVLEAAGTKWNFLKFKPGLVGGHCIGVDPYYLAHKAEMEGYIPNVILSGRRVNDDMGKFVAQKVIKMLINQGNPIKDANILILGFTFKENCPDIRNTRIIDIKEELEEFGCIVHVLDPWADKQEVLEEYKINLLKTETEILDKQFDAIILGVGHDDFKYFDLDKYLQGKGIIYDTKAFFDKSKVDARL